MFSMELLYRVIFFLDNFWPSLFSMMECLCVTKHEIEKKQIL